MTRFALAAVSVVAIGAAGAAAAGGVERSVLPLSVLFEEGNYVELSFGGALPDVSGVEAVNPVHPLGLDGQDSGDMAVGYGNVGLAYKHQLTEEVALGLFYSQPYGANIAYPSGTDYYAAGATAELDTHAVTAVLKYRFPTNFSVFGGIRYQTLAAEAANLNYIPGGYSVEGERDPAWGYLVGVAYERPDIALRVGLTYASEITHELDTTEMSSFAPVPVSSTTEVTTPQSLTLDFQTGIAQDTLLFGSIRWAEWTKFEIAPAFYTGSPVGLGLDPLVEYEDDRWTYSLGLGRQLNETWSIVGTITHEPSTGSEAGNLGPTDGFTGVALGVIYTHANLRVTTGVTHVWLGDAETPQESQFEDNTAVGVGVRIGYSF